MQIAEKSCENCLFSDARIVSPERAEEMIESCLEKDTFFICHKSSMNAESVCCRRFYDLHKTDIAVLRLADFLGVTEFVALPECLPLIPYNQQKRNAEKL